MSGATIVIGGQWGDECKGLLSAYLAVRDDASLVCKAGVGPNAEHGIFLTDRGPYIKVNQLPLGWIFNEKTEILIGSGVAVDLDLLSNETKTHNLQSRILLDPRSPKITKEHIRRERESSNMKKVGSTFSGSGACRSDFISRIAEQIGNQSGFTTVDCAKYVNEECSHSNVIIEASQGTFLSLCIGEYPNVTSDNVTAMAAADDVLLNWQNIKDVVLAVKCLPTREGSGGLGTEEYTQEEIERLGIKEISSIGGVTRRKGKEINMEMLKYACTVNGATQIALTFCEHYDSEMTNVKSYSKITSKLWNLIEQIEKECNVPISILNTGKKFNNIFTIYKVNEPDWIGIEDRLKRKYGA